MKNLQLKKWFVALILSSFSFLAQAELGSVENYVSFSVGASDFVNTHADNFKDVIIPKNPVVFDSNNVDWKNPDIYIETSTHSNQLLLENSSHNLQATPLSKVGL